MILVNLLLLGSIAMMIARVYQPWEDHPSRDAPGTIKLPFRARVRLQRLNIYAVVALVLLGTFGGWLSTFTELLTIALVLLALLIPVRYTITGSSITLGRTAPRQWTQFSGAEIRNKRIRLRGNNDWRDMDVWLEGSERDGHMTALLCQMIRSANKSATPLPPAKRAGAIRKEAAARA